VKKTTKNCYEPVDKQHYKKKYLLRVIEHGEAEEEIRYAKRNSTPKEVTVQMPDMQQLAEKKRNVWS